jgi:DNA-binding IclR family transcriptional regulator
MAAPVYDRYGNVVAAVSLAMPWYRFERNQRRLVGPLRAAADAITARMSSAGEPTPQRALVAA